MLATKWLCIDVIRQRRAARHAALPFQAILFLALYLRIDSYRHALQRTPPIEGGIQIVAAHRMATPTVAVCRVVPPRVLRLQVTHSMCSTFTQSFLRQEWSIVKSFRNWTDQLLPKVAMNKHMPAIDSKLAVSPILNGAGPKPAG